MNRNALALGLSALAVAGTVCYLLLGLLSTLQGA